MEIKYVKGFDLLKGQHIIDELVEVHLANNLIYAPTLYERFKAETEDELRSKLRESIENRAIQGYNFYILYVDGKEIGFNNHKIVIDRIKGEDRKCLEIGTTCISPIYQNRGYGKELYALLDKDAEERYNVEAVVRTTWSTNTRQIHLYNLYGYNVYIQKFDYYGFEGLDLLNFYKIIR